MSKKTKQIFIISLVVSLITMGSLAFFFSRILVQGQLLEDQIAILTDNNNKQTTSVRIKRLVQETEEERINLTLSFFKDEGDSISFLSEIETLAKKSGLDLKTEALDKVTDPVTSREYIKIVFAYEGRKDQVYNFSKLMENIPYHSRVDSLNLRQLSDDSWEGKITILITINPS